jgi:hypothetical protein
MLLLSATDLAIALAAKAGMLRMEERPSRMGGTYIALSDAKGLIEVQDSWAEAHARVEACR